MIESGSESNRDSLVVILKREGLTFESLGPVWVSRLLSTVAIAYGHNQAVVAVDIIVA